jgi:hypothetical protein
MPGMNQATHDYIVFKLGQALQLLLLNVTQLFLQHTFDDRGGMAQTGVLGSFVGRLDGFGLQIAPLRRPRLDIGYCWEAGIAWRIKSSEQLKVASHVTREEYRRMINRVDAPTLR